jgi:hypothetical protein
MYGPYLTVAELKVKYPNEFVYLANPTINRNREVSGGYVILHHPDRAEYYRLMSEWDDPEVKHTALWHTEPKDELEIVLYPENPEPGAAKR